MKKIKFILLIICCIHLSLYADENAVKILAIGNSFSQDAVENYLYELAKTDNKKVVIGNLYIGGCSLETHLNNALNNHSAYEYRKININGNKTNQKGTTLETALKDENWDYISFQEVSSLSGFTTTYYVHLPLLMNYVRQHTTNNDVTFMLHQTWAYAEDSNHCGFARYGNDQLKMYRAIVNTAYSVAKTLQINVVIPSGTAIQNGRTSSVGDNFCCDGYHLNHGIGRFTAACTWYGKIFGANVTENTYIPEGLTRKESKIAKKSAYYAILYPKKITIIRK